MDRNVAYFSLNDTSKFAVIVSVVAAVLLGLPVWWKTTEVYRASLPLAETERLNSEIRANFSLNFPVVVYLQTERWGSYEEVKSWRINDFASRQLSTAFSAKPLVQGESLQKGWSDSDSGAQQAETVLLESHGSPNEQLSVFVLCAEAKVEQGNTRVWVGQRRSLLVETFCGQIRLLEDKVVPIVKVIVLHQAAQLNETKAGALLEMLDERPFPSTNGFAFESYQSILSKQLPFMSAFLGQPEVKRSVPSPHTREKKTRASLKAVKFAPQYQILFSLLVADPMTTGPVSWKVEKAYAETLQPFIDSLKGFLDIKVAFQVVRYAVPTVYAMPQFSETRNPETNETETFPFWTLTPESLAMFVNSAEWPLHSVVRAPILNFLLYIPPAEQTPLFITDGMGRSLETNAFLVSQWGGIVIRNYKMSGSDSVSLQDELTEVMEVWGNQLKDLLGIGSAFPDGAFQKVFHNVSNLKKCFLAAVGRIISTSNLLLLMLLNPIS